MFVRVGSKLRPLRLAAVGFACCAALLAVAGARAGDPGALRGQAGVLEEQNRSFAALEESALLELFALESELASTKQQAQALAERYAALKDERASAKTQHAAARKARNSAQSQLADQLTALYVQGDIDPLAILLGSESLSDAISAIDELSRLAELNEEIINHTKETEAALTAAVDALKEKQSAVRSTAAEVEEYSAVLAAGKLERSAYIERLSADQALNESRIAELQSQAEVAEQRAQELNAAAEAVAAEAVAASVPTSQESASSGGSEASASTAPLPLPANSGPGKTMVVDAVAYSLPGFTASGLPVGPGVVAVDPSVIPLGTRMFVPGYGEAIAADTGSAIIGNIIDLWFPTYGQAAAWGRKTLTITIR